MGGRSSSQPLESPLDSSTGSSSRFALSAYGYLCQSEPQQCTAAEESSECPYTEAKIIEWQAAVERPEVRRAYKLEAWVLWQLLGVAGVQKVLSFWPEYSWYLPEESPTTVFSNYPEDFPDGFCDFSEKDDKAGLFSVYRRSPGVLVTEAAGRPMPQEAAEVQLTLTEVVDIMLQVVEILIRVHEKNVSHNDLKDDNIYVSRAADGSYQATVVGFANATHFGMTPCLPGTFDPALWNAPEVFKDDCSLSRTSSPAADVFSVGWLLMRWFDPQELSPAIRRWVGAARSTLPRGRPCLASLLRVLTEYKEEYLDTDFVIY